jgi:universal stress protein E
MKPLTSILLVLDKEGDATAAIERLAPLAKGSRARLTVVQTMDQVPCSIRRSTKAATPVVLEGPQQRVIELREGRLAKALETLCAQGLRADVQSLGGIPFLEITRQVLQAGHDLVIVPAAETCGIEGKLLGSPALHLMRTCPCPIWAVRSARGRARSGILAVLEADERHAEDLNAKILDLACSLTQSENDELHVLHVRRMDVESMPRHLTGSGQSRRELLSPGSRSRDQKGRGRRFVENGHVSPTMHFYYLRRAAAPLICRLAQERQVDLIVMGTAARPGAQGCVLHDIAETVLHRVDCSVLTVKPEGFVSPVTV